MGKWIFFDLLSKNFEDLLYAMEGKKTEKWFKKYYEKMSKKEFV